MSWNEMYPKAIQPAMSEIERFIGDPLWSELCSYIETTYTALPKVEHSICSSVPGWNVKYKKGGRSLCTLYPNEGYFTALVCIGVKEQREAELLLNLCCTYLQELYKNAKPFNGSRWLMIDVTDKEVLENTKQLISTRISTKK